MKTIFKTGLFSILLLSFSAAPLNAKDKKHKKNVIAPCCIKSFSMDGRDGAIAEDFIGNRGIITLTLADKGANLSFLNPPKIELNDPHASISRTSGGLPTDFSDKVEYTVNYKNKKGEEKKHKYTVHVKK